MADVVLLGDCFEVLQTLDECSVDSCVVDPPYGLNFMGRHWDRGVPATDVWEQVYRVLKPGAHLLSFFGTRTYHRGAVAIEDAGFEIRDQIGWLYGSGFPKSLDVSKAIDKAAGAEREITGVVAGMGKQNPEWNGTAQGRKENSFKPEYNTTAPATDAAKQWDGWGTALKPAWEPIVVARKPLDGTVANNVLTHGVGGLNIDGCRVGPNPGYSYPNGPGGSNANTYGEYAVRGPVESTKGRFPANIIHDGSDEVLAEFAKYGESKSTQGKPRTGRNGKGWGMTATGAEYSDTGTAARFFYCAKANKKERGAANKHPTVKPLALMRYLVRLVTPPGGIVLDPFAGSGTTLVAAKLERFRYIGIEREETYHQTAIDRLADWQVQEPLDV